LRLSKHFVEQWEQRVEEPVPTGEELAEMVKGSVRVQKYRKAYTPRGRSFEVPACYWLPERKIIIKAAEGNGGEVAITVLSAKLVDVMICEE
jgi:hypothetical protein